MKNSEARKTLGLAPGEKPSAFLSDFEETREYKQELINNAPSEELKFRYQQELLEYEAALRVVVGKQKLRPNTDFIVVLLLICSLCTAGWWGYQWHQNEWYVEMKVKSDISELRAAGLSAVTARQWAKAEQAYKQIEAISPGSQLAANGFLAIEEGKVEEDRKPSLEGLLDNLLKDAAKNNGRMELTPGLVEKMGGMEKLMEELQKRAGQLAPGAMGSGGDEFFASSLQALEPVMKKNPGVTALVTVDGKLAALGTVISANGRILTKNAETDEGKLVVRLGGEEYEAKVLKRFPQRDLALLKIDAKNLRPVRFQIEEPALGSILTASGAENEPLGIGLLSVPGRAMSKIGFIGIQAAEGDGGVLIARLVSGGAAEQAGLKENDIITSLDNEKVEDPISFGGLVRGRKAGEDVRVGYLREGEPGELKVTLKERKIRDSVQDDPRMKLSLGRLSEKTGGYPDVIQHDIPLPPELCGGPLFNLKGRCIGVNVSRAGRTKTYAIPADEIVELLNMKAAPKPESKVAAKRAPSKKETLEAIKAIRESMKQIESRLEQLEESLR